jgi:hypothetical protein
MKNVFKLFGVIVPVAIIGFSFAVLSLTGCGSANGGGGNEGNGGGYWLITNQTTRGYSVVDGTPEVVSYTSTDYNWIAYRYTNKTDYEEEYTTTSSSSHNDSYSEHHYTRNKQTSHSTTETISWHSEGEGYDFSGTKSTRTTATNETTATYDLSSGLTSTLKTISSTVTTTNYAIELISDTGEVKSYKYYPLGSTWYNIYKIQNGRTLEVSYYNDSGLQYTTTYIWPDNAEIRSKLPNFTIYSTNYYAPSSSIHSSHQTVDVLPSDNYGNPNFKIQVKTFNDGELSSQTDYKYEKIKFNRTPGSGLYDNMQMYVPGEGNIGVDYKHWGDYYYGEVNGKIIILNYKGTGGNVNIPTQINGKPVTYIGNYAFENCTKLTSVTIPDSVTSIGSSAFENCYKLASVIISNSVTSIGYRAFYRTAWFEQWFNNQSDGVVYMEKVAYLYKGDMPENTSIVLLDGTKGIAGSAFYGCKNLTSITIPNSVTNIGEMAFDGTGLTSVIIGNSVTSIGVNAFKYCDDLTSITIPDSVTDIGEMAFDGTGLTSVTIPASVTYIGELAFAGTGLTSVTFQGTITAENLGFFTNNHIQSPFYGDLRDKYLAGGTGTYTTTTPVPDNSNDWNPVWTKQ